MRIRELFEASKKKSPIDPKKLRDDAKNLAKRGQGVKIRVVSDTIAEAIFTKLLEFKLQLKKSTNADIKGIYWLIDILPRDILSLLDSDGSNVIKQYSLELTQSHSKSPVTHKKPQKGISVNIEALINASPNSPELLKIERDIKRIIKGL